MPIDVSSNGHPAVKFSQPGDTVKGTILNSMDRQGTDYNTKQPATRRDGTPKIEWVIDLQTDERDPANPDDDGKRTLYVNKWRMQQAIAAAVRDAKGTQIEDGGYLGVRYEKDGDAEPGRTAPMLFVAQYRAPDPVAKVAEAFNVPESTLTAADII